MTILEAVNGSCSTEIGVRQNSFSLFSANWLFDQMFQRNRFQEVHFSQSWNLKAGNFTKNRTPLPTVTGRTSLGGCFCFFQDHKNLASKKNVLDKKIFWSKESETRNILISSYCPHKLIKMS